jgi:Zn-finger protein
MAGTKYCPKCNKTMDADTKFYQKRNGEKTDLCKECLTMHIDNFNPDTYV